MDLSRTPPKKVDDGEGEGEPVRKDASSRTHLQRSLKRRGHSARQLIDRPVTFETCSGPITVAVEEHGRKLEVVIKHPEGLAVQQPPAEPPAEIQLTEPPTPP